MLLQTGLEVTEPLLEADPAQPRVAGRNQRSLGQFGSEIPRVRVDDDLARVVTRLEALADQVIEAKAFWTGHFDRAVQWRAHGDPLDRLDDVISSHRLNEYGWQPNRRPDGGLVGDTADELEEL